MIGDYAGARPYYERALAIREQVLGAEHPNTATSLNNLGVLLQVQGDYAGARPYFERALRIFCAALGEQHPSTQTVQNNLEALLAKGEGPHGQTEGTP
jgi:tetratricopeptide (TPR) repeat protein